MIVPCTGWLCGAFRFTLLRTGFLMDSKTPNP
jgi:hypothetical protein